MQAPGWVVPIMRIGFSGRTAVYLLVGGLAVAAAFGIGSAEGTAGALDELDGRWWGQLVLWLIAIGLEPNNVSLFDDIVDYANTSDDSELKKETLQYCVAYVHFHDPHMKRELIEMHKRFYGFRHP